MKNKIIAKNGSRNTVKSNEKYGNKFPDRETSNLIRTVSLTVKAQMWIHIEIHLISDFPLLILYLPFKYKVIYNDIKFCHSIEFFTPKYLNRNKLHWASLKLRGHGNKFHVTATNFFCCNRTKLCFHVRMAKKLETKSFEIFKLIFQDGDHEQKHRGSICSPSFGWRRANQKEKVDKNYLDKALDATQKNWRCFPYNI